MPSQIFKGRVFAAAGPLPGQFTVDNLKRWTSLRKGIFLDDFDETVTHLLCTREQWDNKVPRSKWYSSHWSICACSLFNSQAGFEASQELSNHSLWLVRILYGPEQETSWEGLFHEKSSGETERQEKRKRTLGEGYSTRQEICQHKYEFLAQLYQIKANTPADFYHLYRDRLNFVYEIDITRDDEMTGEVGQKYTLYVSSIVSFVTHDSILTTSTSCGSLTPSLTSTCSQPDFSRRKAALSHPIIALVLTKDHGDRRWISSWISSRRRPALTGKIVWL